MLIEHLGTWASQAPDRTALIWNGQAISYSRFARGIDAVRKAVAPMGLVPGSTAVVAIHNLRDAWTVVLALRSLGLNTVAVMSLDGAVDLGLSQVSCVVTDPSKAQHGAAVGEAWPQARHIQVRADLYSEVSEGPAPGAMPQAVEMGGHLLYTSGTTGQYKLLFQASQGEMARGTLRAACYGVREAAPWFVGHLGLWTAVGYKMPIAAWCVGACVVFDQRVSWPQHFLQHPCDTLLVPAMLSELLEQTPLVQRLGDWQLWVTAGFLSSAQAQEVLTRLTPRLAISYGSTELAGAALTTWVSDLAQMHWLSPHPGREVEVVDEAGELCAEGVEGHLRVRLSPHDATAYLHDAASSEKVFKQGCFYPGDMAVRRADGCVRVLGRNADVLNVQGRKMAVAPVEQAIQDLLGVSQVCVFNGIDAQGLDEVLVVWEGVKEPSQAMQAELRRQLAAFERVRFLMHPLFPRTRTGTNKVDRRALRLAIFGSVAEGGFK